MTRTHEDQDDDYDEDRHKEHLEAVTLALVELCVARACPTDALLSLLLAFRTVLSISGPTDEEWSEENEQTLADGMTHNFEISLRDGLEHRAQLRKRMRKERELLEKITQTAKMRTH